MSCEQVECGRGADCYDEPKSVRRIRCQEGLEMQAYCLRCKAHRGIVDPKEVEMKNGRISVKGRCSVCNGAVSRIKSGKRKAIA